MPHKCLTTELRLLPLVPETSWDSAQKERTHVPFTFFPMLTAKQMETNSTCWKEASNPQTRHSSSLSQARVGRPLLGWDTYYNTCMPLHHLFFFKFFAAEPWSHAYANSINKPTKISFLDSSVIVFSIIYVRTLIDKQSSQVVRGTLHHFQCNSVYLYTEVNPVVCSGVYSQVMGA